MSSSTPSRTPSASRVARCPPRPSAAASSSGSARPTRWRPSASPASTSASTTSATSSGRSKPSPSAPSPSATDPDPDPDADPDPDPRGNWRVKRVVPAARHAPVASGFGSAAADPAAEKLAVAFEQAAQLELPGVGDHATTAAAGVAGDEQRGDRQRPLVDEVVGDEGAVERGPALAGDDRRPFGA